MTKKCQSQRLDKVLRKYSKHNISVGVIKYYYDETIKHSKSETKESIAERVKLNPRKRKTIETRIKMLTRNKLLTRLLAL